MYHLDTGPKWHYFKNVFTDEHCARLANYVATLDAQPASVGGGPLDGDSQNVRPEVRISEVKWIHQKEDTRWLYDILNAGMRQANSETFGFNLHNCQDIQHTTYYGSEKGFYDWHADELLSNNGFMRKLSCIVLLSHPNEYVGGRFEFRDVDSPTNEEFGSKGDVIFFPSFYIHRVNPITSGTRQSLVAWFEGPRWT